MAMWRAHLAAATDGLVGAKRPKGQKVTLSDHALCLLLLLLLLLLLTLCTDGFGIRLDALSDVERCFVVNS